DGRGRHQAMVLQGAINGGLWHQAALCVREVDGELTRRQVRLLKGQIDDRRFDLVRDLVPDPPRSRLAIHQSFDAALLVSAVPVVERRSRDPVWGRCRRVEGDECSTSSMISNFSDAEYLMKRPPHPRERFF